MIQLNFESERTTSAQVVETSVIVNNNSPVQDYVKFNSGLSQISSTVFLSKNMKLEVAKYC